MASFASTILQLALTLLLSAQSNSAAITNATRQQAIAVATEAIQIAEQAIGQTASVSSSTASASGENGGGGTKIQLVVGTSTASTTVQGGGGTSATGTSTSLEYQQGIYGTVTGCSGTVMRDPVTGVATGGCGPSQGAQVTVDQIYQVTSYGGTATTGSRAVGMYTADQTGSYRIGLAPGDYTACVAGGDCSAVTTVASGTFEQVGNLLIAFP